jgi:hypothetical protein
VLDLLIKQANNMKITILKVSSRPIRRKPGRRAGSERPAVYFFLDGENLMQNLQDRRSRPYDLFKQVLDKALIEAGQACRGTDLSWSQYAGCTCPCSPGFIAKEGGLTANVYVTYKMEEGEMPEAHVTYSARRLEYASMTSWCEDKDYDRARNLKSLGEAQKMSKLITDPEKLVRRLKAVMQKSSYEYRKPFITRMHEMGFSSNQINRALGVKASVSVMMPKAA